jgi:hypothetical protein
VSPLTEACCGPRIAPRPATRFRRSVTESVSIKPTTLPIRRQLATASKIKPCIESLGLNSCGVPIEIELLAKRNVILPLANMTPKQEDQMNTAQCSASTSRRGFPHDGTTVLWNWNKRSVQWLIHLARKQ